MCGEGNMVMTVDIEHRLALRTGITDFPNDSVSALLLRPPIW